MDLQHERQADGFFRAEEPEEYARVRRLHPQADESLLRALRDDLEDRFARASELFRESGEAHSGENGRPDWLKLLGKWDETLSNALQLAPSCNACHGENLNWFISY